MLQTLVVDKSCQLYFADEKVPLARAESHWTLVSTHHNTAARLLGVRGSSCCERFVLERRSLWWRGENIYGSLKP